ncbi:hypothetical protein KUCAC02_032896, partial [Chaenocephalus aceratus]
TTACTSISLPEANQDSRAGHSEDGGPRGDRGGRGRGGVRHALSTHRAGTLLCKKGTYFTHEGKGADDAADADTAIINAEGGHTNSDEKKEYYI